MGLSLPLRHTFLIPTAHHSAGTMYFTSAIFASMVTFISSEGFQDSCSSKLKDSLNRYLLLTLIGDTVLSLVRLKLCPEEEWTFIPQWDNCFYSAQSYSTIILDKMWKGRVWSSLKNNILEIKLSWPEELKRKHG